MAQRAIYYRLDDYGEPTPCDSIEGSLLLAKPGGKLLAWDILPGGRALSTAFLVVDHNIFGDGPAILWDSRLFDPNGRWRIVGRYSSKKLARQGHLELRTLIELLRDMPLPGSGDPT